MLVVGGRAGWCVCGGVGGRGVGLGAGREGGTVHHGMLVG